MGGALSGVHPTGTPIVDPFYGGALAALIALACSGASRRTWLVLSAAAVFMSRSWLLLPALAALGLAFSSVFRRHRHRREGALVGALAGQVVLRWPHQLFHGFPSLVAVAAIAPCLVSAFIHLPHRWRRRIRWTVGGVVMGGLVLAVPLVVGTLQARGPVTQGVADAQGALDAVSDGGGANANARLNVASTDFSVGHRRTSAWWAAGAAVIPLEAQQRRALVHATAAGASVTATARDLSGRLGALQTSYHRGALDVARITALGPSLQRLDNQLAGAQRELGSASSSWLISPLQSRLTRLGGELNRAKTTTDLADQAVPVLPGLLGDTGTRHYFMAFMTPSESRGLDGLVAAYGILTADNGHLSLTASGPIGQLITSGQPAQRRLSGPADYLARYGAFDPAYNLQDLSYSPDFPTVANVIAQLYPQATGQHIDGVVALDPYALATLLNFTGPVTVPGLTEQLTAANAAQVLTVGQYAQFTTGNTTNDAARHDVLQAALKVTFTKLSSGSLPSPRTLGADLGPMVHEGRLLFWSNHPAEQPLLRSVGLAGAFPQAEGRDLLAVTTQNAGNNKIDAYLHRTITDQVTYNPVTGQTDSTVTISLHNTAPASGLPSEVIGSFAGSGLPLGTNWTWLSVYSPLSYVSGTMGTAPLEVASVGELGVHTYSASVEIGPGQTETLQLHLTGQLTPGSTYALSLWNQPMVNPDQVVTQVSPTTGWAATDTRSGLPATALSENQVEVTHFKPSP